MARESLGTRCTHLLPITLLCCTLLVGTDLMAEEGSIHESVATTLTEPVGESEARAPGAVATALTEPVGESEARAPGAVATPLTESVGESEARAPGAVATPLTESVGESAERVQESVAVTLTAPVGESAERVQESVAVTLTEPVGEPVGDVAPLSNGLQAEREASSVPEEPANTHASPNTLISSLPAAKGPVLLPAPAESTEVAPLPDTPVDSPIPDPLTAVPVPEKPMGADPSSAKAVGVDQKADQPERNPARLHPAPAPAEPPRSVGLPVPPPPVTPAWRGQHPYNAWGWYWRQQVYAVNQRVYWQYCAVCHGPLPPHRIDALVMRNAQQPGGPGLKRDPLPWSVGPWGAPYQGRQGNGSQRE